MSSGEDADLHPRSKKRRTPRACDFCRRRKIRCNSADMTDNICSNCIEFGINCTHNEAAKRRAPVKSYVESLEQRLAKMEKLLHELSPERDFSQELSDVFPSPGGEASSPIATLPSVIKIMDPVASADEPEDLEINSLTEKLKIFPFMGVKDRFFGTASTLMFVQTALDRKKEYNGGETAQVPPFSSKRAQFWNMHPWEIQAIQKKQCPKYEYPEPDLIFLLSDLYFKKENIFMPLLHQPTFETLIREGLHLREHMFGATVLLVCALGARHSDDPRVFLDGTNNTHSAGWKWFRQVDLLRHKSFLFAPSLYELQAYCLLVSWLQMSSTPQVQWPILGMAIRLAQDIGAHRRKPFHAKWTAQDELMKRAFWILVCQDRGISAFTGRPRAMQDDDFDLDLPIECDDEYWEHEDPEKAWKQPPGKPSSMAYFTQFLKLGEVLGHALRTIHSINKSRILSGIVGPEWEQHIVAQLDSTLNKWIDSVPDHLRWDPHREHDVFFIQSAALFTHYYHLQILIHRPFISSPSKPSRLTFPSLAICANAARSCCHVTEIVSRRMAITFGLMQMAIFAASIVLLLNIWGGRQAGIVTDASKEMAQVHKCMRILKAVEARFSTGGRFWDILYELACVGNLPLPRPSPEARNKRGRDSDEHDSRSTTYDSPPLNSASIDGHRSVRDIRHSSEDIPSPQTVSSMTESIPETTLTQQFTLPMYTNELGRLPLHGQFSFFNDIKPFPAPAPGQFADQDCFSTGSMSNDGQFIAGPRDSFETRDASLFGVPSLTLSPTFAAVDPHGFLQDPESRHASTEQPWSPAVSFDPSRGMSSPNNNPAYAMWSTVPTTFGIMDWGLYLSNAGGDPIPVDNSYDSNDR